MPGARGGPRIVLVRGSFVFNPILFGQTCLTCKHAWPNVVDMTTKTTNCRRCHALLTDPRRVAERIGRRCKQLELAERAAQERHEAAVTVAVDQVNTIAFKDPQAVKDKAVQLILDGAIVPTRIPGVYLANGSDGVSTYLVDTVEDSCSCPAATRIGRCNHKIAAAAENYLTGAVLGLAA